MRAEKKSKISPGPKLSPLRRERLNEQAVSRIRQLILSNELKIGDKLPPERDLAKQLNVSRVVVREALRSLEQSGLIEIKTGTMGGSFVINNLQKPLSDSVYLLYESGALTPVHFIEARRVIESYGIRQAAENATPEIIKSLTKLNESMLENINDREKFRKYHLAFHIAIADLSGNPLLKLIIQSIFDLWTRIFPAFTKSKAYMKEVCKKHTAIIEALDKKDARLCELLIIDDLPAIPPK